MTLQSLFFNQDFAQVGLRRKHGSEAQSRPLHFKTPAVSKHGELISRERCPLPGHETSTTLTSRQAFSDMTRSMNAMPQPSSAPSTCNPRPDSGAALGLPFLQVPSQVFSDELNTPEIVFDPENSFKLSQELAADQNSSFLQSQLSEYADEGAVSFNLNQFGVNSQEMVNMANLLNSQQDPVMSADMSGSQSSLAQLEICSQEMAALTAPDNMVTSTTSNGPVARPGMQISLSLSFTDVGISTPDCQVGTPELMKFDQNFDILKYCDEGPADSKQDLQFQAVDNADPMEGMPVLKQEPGSPASSSGCLTMDLPAPSPDGASPGHSGLKRRLEADSGSETSFVAGPSKQRARRSVEDEHSSMFSSASDLNRSVSRDRNNEASRRSRQNKKCKDTGNESFLKNLEDENLNLRQRCEALEKARDAMRALVKARLQRTVV